MARRRISYVLICYAYPPVLGGSEIEAQRISDALQKRGHRPTIVCTGGGPMPPVTEWVDPFGLRVRLYGGGWREGRQRDIAFALGVAWTLITKRRHYEVAYFLSRGLHLATGLPVARLLKKPIVMKFAGSGHIVALRKSWLGRLELLFLRRWASHVLVLNEGMVEEALEVGIDKARIRWMPNPVDTEQFCPCSPQKRAQLRRELGVAPDAPLTVFVGRLAAQKELPLLMEAFERIVRDRPDAVLALVGDGLLRAELRQLASSLRLDRNVIFTGRLDTAGVLKWLQAGDVFTLISAAEGLPCALIEAMAVGLPAVVSDILAHRQLVDSEVEGIVTQLRNQKSIARGVLRLLDEPATRVRMGAAARQRMLETFATQKVVDCYERLLSECTSTESSIH
jgi:glycosyltransferase involved in cell wall biosynthesis